MHRGANLPALGDFNQRVVLDCIRRSPEGLSRVELAELTGLSPQTMSNVTRRLLEASLVVERGVTVHGPGRPRQVIGLNPRGMYSIGVHLDPAELRVLVLDLGGAVVARGAAGIPVDADPDQVLDLMADEVHTLVAQHGIDEELVAGVGVAVPGPMDPRRGVVVDPPLLRRWSQVPLREQLAGRLDSTVVLEKDVIAAAVGEVWLAPTQADASFLFAYLGSGFGVGLVQQGEVQRGVSHNFGEAGHLVVGDDGPPCQCCGRRGTIGILTAPWQLAALAADAGLAPAGDDWVSQDAALVSLARHARAGDPTAGGILARVGEALGEGLALLTDLLDTDRVVMAGRCWEVYGDLVHPLLSQRLSVRPALRSVRPVSVATSSAAHDVVAVGAASLVLDQLLSPRPSGLVIQPV